MLLISLRLFLPTRKSPIQQIWACIFPQPQSDNQLDSYPSTPLAAHAAIALNLANSIHRNQPIINRESRFNACIKQHIESYQNSQQLESIDQPRQRAIRSVSGPYFTANTASNMNSRFKQSCDQRATTFGSHPFETRKKQRQPLKH